jgi:hypothetical protein
MSSEQRTKQDTTILTLPFGEIAISRGSYNQDSLYAPPPPPSTNNIEQETNNKEKLPQNQSLLRDLTKHNNFTSVEIHIFTLIRTNEQWDNIRVRK